MSSPMNSEDLKKFLQDAGMYEENMNDDEMLSYYNAIKSSENTAKEEDICRHNNDIELLEDQDGINDDQDAISIVEEHEKMNTSDKSTEDIIIGTIILDPMNCKPSKPYEFHRTPHIVHYNLPPYLDLKYRHLSIEDRAKVISEFHYRQLEAVYENFNKNSDPDAPMGKDLHVRFINTGDSIMEEINESGEETYISRSGRHTRRKDYSEYDQFQRSSQSKREKRDKNFNCTPSTSRHQIHSLTNEQIMQRSRLFSDSPKSSPPSTTVKSINIEQKSSLDETAMESQLKSSNTLEKKYSLNPLWLVQSEDVEKDEVTELGVEELPVIRRRVPPPIRGRKGISKRSRSNLEMESCENITKSLVKPILQVTPSVSSSNSHNSSPPNGSNKKRKTKSTMMCPICSEYFKSEEVEEHASNCGLGMTNPVIFEPASNQPLAKDQLQCSICNKVMGLTTDYEIHVADCVRGQQMK